MTHELERKRNQLLDRTKKLNQHRTAIARYTERPGFDVETLADKVAAALELHRELVQLKEDIDALTPRREVPPPEPVPDLSHHRAKPDKFGRLGH